MLLMSLASTHIEMMRRERIDNPWELLQDMLDELVDELLDGSRSGIHSMV